MGMKIKVWKGAWWTFINHQGSRKTKRVGVGSSGKKAAQLAAQQIQAKLILGGAAFEAPKATLTLQAYLETWLEHIKPVRKHTTYDGYKNASTSGSCLNWGRFGWRTSLVRKCGAWSLSNSTGPCPPRPFRTT